MMTGNFTCETTISKFCRFLHRVPKKESHQTFANNFLKSQPIFKILSLLDRG